MNHAITWGEILSGLAILAGIGTLALCALMIFASMMSDSSAGDDGPPIASCLIPLAAIGLIALGIWGLA